jgi:hypothetical protein
MATEVKLLDSGKIEVTDVPPEIPKKPKYKEKIANLTKKYGRVLGVMLFTIIIIILAVVLPLVVIPRLFSSIPDSFRSLLTRNPRLTINPSEESINSGDMVTLNLRTNVEGQVVLSYPCTPNTEFVLVNEETNITIPCDTNFTVEPTEENETPRKVVLEAFTENTTAATVPITVSITSPNATTTPATDTVDVEVRPDGDEVGEPEAPTPAATSTPTEPAPTEPAPAATSTPPAQTSPAPQRPHGSSGMRHVPLTAPDAPTYNQPFYTIPQQQVTQGLVQGVDLQVTNFQFAGIDAGGRIVPIAGLRAGLRSVVQFEVRNNGNQPMQSWEYRVDLPVNGDRSQTIVGNNQAPLPPGGRVRISVVFTPTYTMNGNVIRITLNPNRRGGEVNYTNNTIVVPVQVQ